MKKFWTDLSGREKLGLVVLAVIVVAVLLYHGV